MPERLPRISRHATTQWIPEQPCFGAGGWGVNAHLATGFTLIELLVVVAIIAVLAALLMPALRSARESAWQVQCISRMKQIILATQTYSNDDEGRIIGYNKVSALPAYKDYTLSYEDRIAPYLGAPRRQNSYDLSLAWIAPLRCPRIPISNPDLSMSHPASILCGRTWVLNGIFTTAENAAAPKLYRPKLLGEFRTPDRLVYAADGFNIMFVAPLTVATLLPGQDPSYTVPAAKPQEKESIFFPHRGRATLAYLDGHVGGMPPIIYEELLVPAEYPRGASHVEWTPF